jgi:hypothetical protein
VYTVEVCFVFTPLQRDALLTFNSEVTGTTIVTTGPPAVAATRPPDVSTVYTAPRTSVSAYTTSPQPPAYGSSTTQGQSVSVTGSPGSSPAISTPMMTSSSLGVSNSNPGSSSAVNSPYGGGSSSSLSGSAPVVSPSLSVHTSSASSAVSPPSQYTNPGGASSTQSSAGPPASYSNPGGSISVPVSSPTNGGVPESSSGTVTSIRHSSASSVSISSVKDNQPGVSTSNGGPTVYGSSSVTPSLSNNSPPPYGQSTASPAPSNNSPSPYGGSTSAPSSSGNAPPTYGGSTTVSPPTTSAVAPSAETLCPTYGNKNYTDSNGATYTVYCGQDFAGTPLNPSHRRQATTYTIQSCMAVCDQYTACIAASTDGTSCNLFSSVTGTTGSPGTVAAYKVSGSTKIVQTVTVCANKVTAYTTVWTTATHTTCPANSVCTAGAAYSNGFIGTARARR